jgi:hypothetical protein
MSNNFGLFLLFSVLVTGLVINPAFAQDPNTNGTALSVNATETTSITASSNSTSAEDDTTGTEDNMMEDDTTGTEDDMMEDDTTGTEDDMMEEEETVVSPLKQIKEGIAPENVTCKEGLELVFKLNGQPACIKTASIQKLIAWGWTQ